MKRPGRRSSEWKRKLLLLTCLPGKVSASKEKEPSRSPAPLVSLVLIEGQVDAIDIRSSWSSLAHLLGNRHCEEACGLDTFCALRLAELLKQACQNTADSF